MKNVGSLLDSTYLKTVEQAGITEPENQQVVIKLVQEAIKFKFKLIMIRPNYVSMARKTLDEIDSTVLVGTVIGFPSGTSNIESKIAEAKKAIKDGVDELDFVIDYRAYQQGYLDQVEESVKQCTSLCLKHGKVTKWIIEIAALSDEEIAGISKMIKEVVLSNFSSTDAQQVFVKSSTGFYKREDGGPVGATLSGLKIMIDHAAPLPVKAAGGVKNLADIKKMVELGVSRIGTSSAKQIVLEETTIIKY
jgi:deoxyribose-phosphate aldolase